MANSGANSNGCQAWSPRDQYRLLILIQHLCACSEHVQRHDGFSGTCASAHLSCLLPCTALLGPDESPRRVFKPEPLSSEMHVAAAACANQDIDENQTCGSATCCYITRGNERSHVIFKPDARRHRQKMEAGFHPNEQQNQWALSAVDKQPGCPRFKPNARCPTWRFQLGLFGEESGGLEQRGERS